MKKLATTALAVCIGLGSIAAATNVASADWKRGQYPNSWQNGWHGSKGDWKKYSHNKKYNHNYNNNNGWGVGAGLAAGAILGLTIGALTQPSYAYPVYPYAYGPVPVFPTVAATEAHIEDCIRRFRTYDPATNLYRGYDGYYHQCRGPY